MENKHTPGPWRPMRWWEDAGMTLANAEDDEERQEWLSEPFLYIKGPDGSNVVACTDLSEMTEADARLISKSPELLEIAEELFADLEYDYGDGTYPLFEKLRAIIAAAKGIECPNQP